MKANELKSKIILKGYGTTSFVDELNKMGLTMNRSTYYRKLNGTSEFTQSEIKVISDVLSLNSDEIMDIFFSPVVS